MLLSFKPIGSRQNNIFYSHVIPSEIAVHSIVEKIKEDTKSNTGNNPYFFTNRKNWSTPINRKVYYESQCLLFVYLVYIRLRDTFCKT